MPPIVEASRLESTKNNTIAYICWGFGGIFGCHYYYLKKFGWGILFTCTAGLAGFGFILDGFHLPLLVERFNKPSSSNERILYHNFEVYKL